MAFVTCSSLVISNKTVKFIGQDQLIEGTNMKKPAYSFMYKLYQRVICIFILKTE